MEKTKVIELYIKSHEFRRNLLFSAIKGDPIAASIYTYMNNGLVFSAYLENVTLENAMSDIPWRSITVAEARNDSQVFPNNILIANDCPIENMTNKSYNFLRDNKCTD